jgi:anti-sigma B factor antagonist
VPGPALAATSIDSRPGGAPDHRYTSAAASEGKVTSVQIQLISADGESPIVLQVTGEVDIQTAPELFDKITEVLDAGALELILDLDGVSFLDSSGLGVLIGANKRILAAGGSFKLVTGQETVLKVFRITRLVDVFRIYDTRDGALAG